MKRTSFESMPCPLARALEHLSDSWNALILREAFYGATRFDEFESTLGIASNTLTRRLKDMTGAGLFERRLYNAKPPRYEYVLTEKGKDLRPVLLTLLQWGNKYSKPPGASVHLVDTATGNPVELALIDAVTGDRIGGRHKVVGRSSGGRAQQSYPFPDSTSL
jgi:DNA-binding HxlR family transcriptional regulator